MGRLSGMKGGGFLNNVDGTLVDYEFTNTFPGQSETPDELYVVLTVRPDGADEEVQTTLRFGSAQFLRVQDSHTVINPEGNVARFWDKSDGYHFLESLEKVGVADGGIDESDPSIIALTGLIGRRMRFVQERDEERMDARQKAGKNPRRVDEATGKEYPFTRLIVEQVYDTTPVVGAPRTALARGAAKPVGGGTTPATRQAKGVAKASTTPFAKGGKPNGAAVAATIADDTRIEAIEKLRAILDANGGSVLRSDLTRLATTLLLTEKNPRREVLRKLIYSPEFLGSVDGVVFDTVGQTVSVA